MVGTGRHDGKLERAWFRKKRGQGCKAEVEADGRNRLMLQRGRGNNVDGEWNDGGSENRQRKESSGIERLAEALVGNGKRVGDGGGGRYSMRQGERKTR